MSDDIWNDSRPQQTPSTQPSLDTFNRKEYSSVENVLRGSGEVQTAYDEFATEAMLLTDSLQILHPGFNYFSGRIGKKNESGYREFIYAKDNDKTSIEIGSVDPNSGHTNSSRASMLVEGGTTIVNITRVRHIDGEYKSTNWHMRISGKESAVTLLTTNDVNPLATSDLITTLRRLQHPIEEFKRPDHLDSFQVLAVPPVRYGISGSIDPHPEAPDN